MRANRSDHDLNQLHTESNDNQDTKSCIHFNVRQNSSSKSSSNRLDYQQPSMRSYLNKNNLYADGLIINGCLFDGYLFQPSRSSYILDYSQTPDDLNHFIEGYHMTLENSTVDPHLFKISFIITLTEGNMDKELILDYCPRLDDENRVLNEILYYKRFCFPELTDIKSNEEINFINESSTYIFTRTNSNGQVEYGYCRRINNEYNNVKGIPIIICIVSNYSCFKLYDAILGELVRAYLSNDVECNLLMQSFYSKPYPISNGNSSGIVCILNNRRVFFYVRPNDERLDHDYFSTLISCLSPNNIIILFESMLRSKKILCFSQSMSKLTKCCLALSYLLYPFIWPYSFVSLMPSLWLNDLLESPCPYIYGCLDKTKSKLSCKIENSSLCVDLDSDKIFINDNINSDGFILPSNLRETLLLSLEYLVKFRFIKLNSILVNIAVSEAFLNLFIELFYRLPEYFKRNQISTKTNDNSDKKQTQSDYHFQTDEFLISQPISSYIVFLNDFIYGMIFLKFLDDYQPIDNNSKQSFSLLNQRLNERRRMSNNDISITPFIRFQQTFDLLEKQMKQATKSTNPIISNFVKKLFQ